MNQVHNLYPLVYYTNHPRRYEFFFGIDRRHGNLVFAVPPEHENDFQDSIKRTKLDDLSQQEADKIELYYEMLIYHDFKIDKPLNTTEMLERVERFISNNLI